ncbi:MAG: NAD(P)/FAD-dependent oxidoreductase [Clostridia bacterium]|nr:NAD(P)/FAD-dependent oxidoreductase [Clostridia bacterium]
MEYDVIIVGAGPAGTSASLYTIRGNLKTLILYEDKSGLEKTDKIENYYGFENGVSGKELYETGIKQAQKLGGEVRKEEVIKVEKIADGFFIQTSQAKYKAKVVILATGNKKNKPQIIGIEKFEGKGVSYCAICDGFFYRNRNVVVVGSGDYAISETNDLINMAKHITILTNGEKAPEFRADNVKINTKNIKEIHGQEKVEEVEFKDGSKIKTDGLFVAQGVAGSANFAKKLGAITKQDKIVVNHHMETNIKGLYACGDCTGGLLQIAKAVHEGAIAGLQAIKYIKLMGGN